VKCKAVSALATLRAANNFIGLIVKGFFARRWRISGEFAGAGGLLVVKMIAADQRVTD
jgi:hypothetical protein